MFGCCTQHTHNMARNMAPEHFFLMLQKFILNVAQTHFYVENIFLDVMKHLMGTFPLDIQVLVRPIFSKT
jgi:hypothetical protein